MWLLMCAECLYCIAMQLLSVCLLQKSPLSSLYDILVSRFGSGSSFYVFF